MTPTAPSLWAVRLTVPAGRAAAGRIAASEAALEPLAEALSTFELAGGSAWAVEALCRRRPGARRLQALARSLGLGAAEVTAVPARDWVAESQRGLAPFRAGRFQVRGSHVGYSVRFIDHNGHLLGFTREPAENEQKHQTTIPLAWLHKDC